ncbi:MAG: RNA-directed DNA polymerase [Candidatus Saccharibacteria bacterium]|nr:RNA-directed DNA polymerase [Candidatus Saccharibacteria bacterium]
MKLIDENDKKWLENPKNQLLFELNIAYNEARRGGKRGTFDEHKFEINEATNLVNLRDTLLDRTYRPSRGTAHIIYNPVIREIFAAPFRDRIIHHWIYNCVYDWWDRRFVIDSYSCREGKGTKYGIDRLAHHIRSLSDNYKKEIYVIKLDVQGYFMSLDREKLFKRAIWGLDQQFKNNKNWKYHLLKFCWEQIIFDDPIKGVIKQGWPNDWKNLPRSKSLFYQPKGKGIVIGNLTSQLLSNIYLDQLDRYIIYDLGYKHYGRYVDDFYFLVEKENLEKAKNDIKAIERYLTRLGLTLHPKKRYIQPVSRGVPFVGAVVYPGRIYPSKRLVKNFRTAVHEVATGRRDPESIASYLGHLKYLKSDKLITKVFAEVGWKYRR